MNGKDTVKIATIGMSTDLKAARLLNTSAIDTNFLMETKIIGKKMNMRKYHGILMILICQNGLDSIFKL